MTFEKMLDILAARSVRLQKVGDRLNIGAPDGVLDDSLIEQLRVHKASLLNVVRHDEGGWWSPALRITPDMLPLVKLSEVEIERIVAGVEGGAVNVQDIYPLVPLQEGILFHHLLNAANDPYVLTMLIAFDSRARLDAYVAALREVVARHDILRTAVAWEGISKPVQVVWRHVHIALEELQLDPAAGDLRMQLHSYHAPIDVRQAPLLRLFAVHDVANGRWLLLTRQHHLIGDHVTMDGVHEEIGAHLSGTTSRLPPPVPFRNFVAQARLGTDQARHEAYFKAMLGDVEMPTAPFGLLDVQGTGRYGQDSMKVEDGLSERLRTHARRLGVSVATLFHLAWSLVLARVSGTSDVVFGTVMLGRMQGGEGVDRAMGLFINTLPIRIRIDHESVEAVARNTQATLVDLMQHEYASLILAQRCSGVPAPTPLFSALLNYRHSASGTPAAQTWQGIELVHGEEHTNYPLVLSVDDFGDAFGLTVQVDASVNARRVCRFMQSALDGLARSLERGGAEAIRDLDVLPPDERCDVLERWNATTADYPKDVCVHELFEMQSASTPDAVAVMSEAEQLTYRELNERTNQLAHYLRALGVGPDKPVAVCLERGLGMIVGLLGILKAGGAYVPLDPAYPEERLEYMLADSKPEILIGQGEFARRWKGRAGLRIVDMDETLWLDCPETNPAPADVGLNARHLAYILYTSGSTGQPKGVMNQHDGVVNRLLWAQKQYQVGPDDCVLQKTPFSFDVSVWELFLPLLAGARLMMARPGGHQDPLYLQEEIARRHITMLHFVPSMLQVFLEHLDAAQCRSLRRVMCSGEALPVALQRYFLERLPEVELHNLYGPTEAAIDVTAWHCRHDPQALSVPIGYPVANTRIYILDPYMQLVPAGVTGEIFIGGVQVARGYLNRPELTAERFVTDPFSNEAQARMYKTGDLGRWLPDGSIEYLGRNDFQVKIRGFRIELGEIEAKLGACEGVREAVVVAREDEPGEKRLVAYMTAKEGTVLSAGTLREHLQGQLPEHMVPSAFVVLEAFPLTPNGKLDRKALPTPDGNAVVMRQYEAPQGKIEIVIAGIWQELLGVEKVGRHDHFYELGGHSLKLVMLVTQLKHAFGVAVPIMQLYRSPTVAGQAALVRKDGNFDTPVVQRLTPALGRHDIAVLAVPYAAGDGIIYHSLTAALPGNIAVYAINNPRDFDRDADLDAAVEGYLDSVVQSVRDEIQVPLVIWGHCVGYALAMTLTRRLLDAGVSVRALCVGGVYIHAGQARYVEQVGGRAPQMSHQEVVALLTDAGLQSAHGELDAAAWDEIVGKYDQDILLADWCEYDHFCRAITPKLAVPVICVTAKDDPLTSGAPHTAVLNWMQISDTVHAFELADGGHYFVHTRSTEVATLLTSIAAGDDIRWRSLPGAVARISGNDIGDSMGEGKCAEVSA